MLLLSILTLFVLLVGLGGGAYVVRQQNKKLDSYADAIYEFFTPISEDKPSAFAETVNAVGQTIGEHARVAITAGLQGSLGGTMKGVNAELEQQAIADNPSLALLQVMPKSIKKSPLASIALGQIFERFFNNNSKGGGAIGGGNGRRSNEQSSFTI